MEYIALAFFGVIAAATFGASVDATVRHYRCLPQQVPEHFDGYGWPDGYGPRPMIFAGIFAQAVPIAIWAAIVFNVVHEGDALRIIFISGVILDAIILAIAYLHSDILAVARGTIERLRNPLRPLAFIAIGVVVAIGLGRLLP
jgi:hypothetical protein